MNINKNFIHTMAGVDYFNLTEDSMAAFGFNVKTWAGERVQRVDVHKRFPTVPRKLTVVTESGRTFQVTVAEGTGHSLIPLSHFA